MTDREAYIVLNMISGVGTSRLKALVENFGEPHKIFRQTVENLGRIKGISEPLAHKIISWEQDIDLRAELEFTRLGGARIITLADAEYPEILHGIYDPPLCLYVRGELPDFSHNSLAVVGSRRATIYGRKMAKHIAVAAVLAGWKVISGLAFGIDAVAHQAAVEAGGVTVAVLGGGLARIHPQEHVPLARSIIDGGGALISEFPMKFPVNRQSFPRRNRIVSGLSRAVLVVEAGLQSGALITADLAMEQGKDVFAVPGHVDNPQAKGCHKLIKQGAKLTEDFSDILEDYDFLPGFARPQEVKEKTGDEDREDYAAELPANLSEAEYRILQLLQDEAKSFDYLADYTKIPVATLNGLLTKMAIKMLLVQHPGKIYSLRG
ncbi:MAG: DNA-processing protein DprA [Victivallaceae bacterium]|nr:DNA-processing protein DprA [Victivallaceae bacterium]